MTETIEKMRQAKLGAKNPNFGKHPSPETREKLRQAHLGTQHTPAAIEKIRQANLGRPSLRKGTHVSLETLRKMREVHMGHFVSDVTRKKIREYNKKTGKCPPSRKGWQHSSTSIEKMKLVQTGRKVGEKNPNWHGGISFEEYSIAWTEDLKEAIRKRDKCTCQFCGKKQEDLSEKLQKKLHVHHIDYDKKNLDFKNLISLCRSCHSKTNYNREKWTGLLQTLVNKR